MQDLPLSVWRLPRIIGGSDVTPGPGAACLSLSLSLYCLSPLSLSLSLPPSSSLLKHLVPSASCFALLHRLLPATFPFTLHVAMTDMLSAQPPATTRTPSGLTPTTRSEAEAALSANSTAQTDSAAPTTQPAASDDEARRAYHRPPGPIRTSSAQHAAALAAAHSQPSADSSLSVDTMSSTTPTAPGEAAAVGLPVPPNSAVSPTSPDFPSVVPGAGVVPLHPGVGAGQADVVRRARPGLSLGALARAQSWSEQDFKHVASGRLMVGAGSGSGAAEEHGYASGEGGSLGVGK